LLDADQYCHVHNLHINKNVIQLQVVSRMRRFLLLTVSLYWPVIYGKSVFASEIPRGVMLSNSCAA